MNRSVTGRIGSEGAAPDLLSSGGRLITRALGTDDWPTYLAVVATFVAYLIADRLTVSVAVLTADDLGSSSLLGTALANRWSAATVVAALLVVAVALRPAEALARWRDFEHGTALRVAAASLILLLAWRASLYDINFVADRVHGIDRIVVVLLGAAAIARPLAIVPFVMAVRTINEQFLFPFGTVGAKNVDELLIIALLAMVATHAVYVATRRSETSPTVLLASAAVAAHFFWPGKAKLVSGWLFATDISHLPLSSRTAGWLGHTDGGFAESLSSSFASLRWPMLLGTLAIELGAVVAVLHPKWLRPWLVGFVLFHTVTFATTGFFFLGWSLLELGLLAALTAPRWRGWVRANATPARGALAVAAVIGGPVLFHPPGLAWFDAPVSYGYEIEATGVSGSVYHVPISALAPLDQDVSFARLQLDDRLAGSGGYGALSTRDELDRLNTIVDFDQLAAYETTLGEPPPRDESVAFFVAFFDHTNTTAERGGRPWWLSLGPPDRFWTSREEPAFDFSEPLSALDVILVASIHDSSTIDPADGGVQSERRAVLRIEADEAGKGRPTPGR